MFTSPAVYSPAELLQQSSHRPFDLPQNRPWIMAQTWKHLLFAHWKIPASILRPMIPPEIELDTYNGEAWLGVVPFLMTGVRLRGFAPMPGTATFPELNLRTYVNHNGKPGVWFFSLEAANPLAVMVARLTFNLPYFNAKMSLQQSDNTISYRSHRTHSDAKSAEFIAKYQPIAPVKTYDAASLDRWLTDRYVLYSVNRKGQVFIGHIMHLPWGLQAAEATIERNTIAEASGINLSDEQPLLHYVEQLDVLAWAIQPI